MNAKEFGDFQTPLPLAREVLAALGDQRWTRVLEPTCGRGSFLRALAERGEQEMVGIELQDAHIEEARAIPTAGPLTILKADFFAVDLCRDLPGQTRGPLLVVGNPPWVTNAALGKLGSGNLPRKSNFKRRRGIDALTGCSNFDLAESIWFKLINELAHEHATIALLCKTSVARSVLDYCYRAKLPVSNACIRLIDARRWFNAVVDACLFTLTVNNGLPDYEALMFDSLSAPAPQRTIGFAGDTLVADTAKYRTTAFLDGPCALEWRQGVKHDAASVMELIDDNGSWRNRRGELVDVEYQYIYPLVKGADLPSKPNHPPRRGVIIPQARVGQDTRLLQTRAPKLWRYLASHADVFAARKSSVYRGQPPFAIFGVGEYSFAPYKVLVSGLHKKPRFVLVGPRDGKPVMCDDTCYLLPFDTLQEAAQVAAALNHPLTMQFVESLLFADAKRPITKSLLKRIDIGTLLRHLASEELSNTAKNMLGSINIHVDDVKEPLEIVGSET